MLAKAYKIARRVFFYALFTFLLLVTAGVVSLWLFGDQIKAQIVQSFNETVNTPVNVSSIDLDAFSHFPFVTIRFNDVDVQESIELSYQPLLLAESVEFTVSPIGLLRGDNTIHSIIVNEGTLDLKVNRRNQPNYVITKPKEDEARASSSRLDINSFVLNNVEVSWKHVPRGQDFTFRTDQLKTSVELIDTTLFIGLVGGLEVRDLKFNESNYLKGKKFETSAELKYFNTTGKVSIQESLLIINDSDFIVKGYYDPSKKGEIDFTLDGSNTDIQTLLSFLTDDIIESVNQYRSEGDVYFSMGLKGRINEDESPAITADFGIKNATITYPDTGKKLENVSLEGNYASSSLTELTSATLNLRGISAVMEGKSVAGSLSLTNFEDKHLQFDIEGQFDVDGLLSFFPNEYLKDASGLVDLSLQFEGRIKDLENLSTIGRVNSEGQLNLSDVSFRSEQLNHSFSDLNGSLLFNKNVLALEELSGQFGSNHFVLDGMVRNIFSFLLTENQPLKLQATLKSDFIDFDELLSAKSGEASSDYSLVLSPLLDLEFNCQIGEVRFKKFSGQNLAGVVKIKDQLAMLQGIRFDEIGGNIELEGLVDTKGETVEVLTRFSTHNIHVDSLFYVFEDFDQDFLVHDHLRGRLTSSVNAEMKFTKKLEFIPQSLVADMQAKIEKGELIGFEPLSELSAYIPDDSLLYLKFSELENEIHVENQTIYLPRMEVRSNVTAITIGGTHTFNNHINYKVVAPIIHTRRLDKDEDFAAIEDDGSSVPKIHILITGTTDDYYVTLDKSGVKNQLVTELKTEVTDLKNAFRKKQKTKQKELVLDEEDEFDW